MNPWKILVVDDSELMRRTVCRALEGTGAQVFEGAKARDGMQILLQQPIDLLITDWNMIELDGLELTRVLRSLSSFESLPILMLSTHDSDESRLEAQRAGVDAFVPKDRLLEDLRIQALALLERRGSAGRCQPSASPPKPAPSPAGAASALLLGFSEERATQLRKHLERLGYRGAVARDPWDALAFLQNTAGVQLLVVEWTRLCPDYLNMVLQLQQDPRWKAVRVLVLMPQAAPTDAPFASHIEAHGFLRTDCGLDELCSTLRAMGLRVAPEASR